ncbi:hypothetical protein LDC_0061 [sediment metagenome]|uniref:Secretion system C-terminal sorting domain-containing protein n=1 Tax=sediment metagenome TaxID=749907 RepID=D9PEY3_9ZZZZ
MKNGPAITMKKLLPFNILLWLCFISHAQTNVYHEFPDSNALWNVEQHLSDGGYIPPERYCDSASKETKIINGLTYHCIYRRSPDYYKFYAAIREDTTQKKVFVVLPDSTSETLLYDFSLKKGDRFKGYMVSIYKPIIVGSIDSIAINSTFRKRWNFIDTSTKYSMNIFSVIEGVGSTEGLIERYTGFEYFSDLICFSQNNKTLYPYFDSLSKCILKPVSVIEYKKIENEISISPNPSNGKFQVMLKGFEANALEITDVLGKEILNMKIMSDTFEINLIAQPQGIYFVKISDSIGNFSVEKIMKN